MSIVPPEWAKDNIAGWYDCPACHNYTGGSHWHCGACNSEETTSMFGHYHGIHSIDGQLWSVEGHMSCAEGACENAKILKKLRFK